jgi:hypothetical protein
MAESVLLPRVLVTRDGTASVQLVSCLHNTADRSAYLSFRPSIDDAEQRVVVRVGEGVDLASMGRGFGLPDLDSGFLATCVWQLWDEFDVANEERDSWTPGSSETHYADPSDLIRRHRERRTSTFAPSVVVEAQVAHSARFGVPAIIDKYLAAYVGCTYEQLRKASMDRADVAWRVSDDRPNSRLELEALGAFRAAHGILTVYELRAQLTAPRYAGVLEYWDRALELRLAPPADPAGAIANAAHAVESLACLLAGHEANTAGSALSTLSSSGRLPHEVAAIAKYIHGRTSGDIGVRHGKPDGPTDSQMTADYYLDLMAASLRQLLLIDNK